MVPISTIFPQSGFRSFSVFVHHFCKIEQENSNDVFMVFNTKFVFVKRKLGFWTEIFSHALNIEKMNVFCQQNIFRHSKVVEKNGTNNFLYVFFFFQPKHIWANIRTSHFLFIILKEICRKSIVTGVKWIKIRNVHKTKGVPFSENRNLNFG